MIKSMIKALEGGREQLLENESEIRDIISRLNIVADKVDRITCNYSEIILPKAISDLFYGVMNRNDDYYEFNYKRPSELKEWFFKLEPYQFRKTMMIYRTFFSWYDVDFTTNGDALFREGHLLCCKNSELDFDIMIKELDEAIEELKTLCQ